ncbi:hypothetical protein E4U43_005493, partial [Claviceps pusilla]
MPGIAAQDFAGMCGVVPAVSTAPRSMTPWQPPPPPPVALPACPLLEAAPPPVRQTSTGQWPAPQITTDARATICHAQRRLPFGSHKAPPRSRDPLGC